MPNNEHLITVLVAHNVGLQSSVAIAKWLLFHYVQENVSLLREINDLRTELKKSRTLSHDLEATLKIARKQGFDEQAALSSTKPPPPNTGIVRVEPSDSSRIIEMQKLEISRLRSKLRDQEATPPRASGVGEKLPPVINSAVSVQ